jgi:DDE family transposase
LLELIVKFSPGVERDETGAERDETGLPLRSRVVEPGIHHTAAGPGHTDCDAGGSCVAEVRIRCAKDTGLRNLSLKGFAQNQLWCEIVALACELLAWTQMLALTGNARRWEPKRLRLRIFTVADRDQAGQRVDPPLR